MAGIALIVLYRGVFVFAFKIYTIVTLHAVKRQRSAGDHQQKQEREYKNIYAHTYSTYIAGSALNNMHETLIHHGVLSS
jgi:flagellar basal body-associated protein FliL